MSIADRLMGREEKGPKRKHEDGSALLPEKPYFASKWPACCGKHRYDVRRSTRHNCTAFVVCWECGSPCCWAPIKMSGDQRLINRVKLDHKWLTEEPKELPPTEEEKARFAHLKGGYPGDKKSAGE